MPALVVGRTLRNAAPQRARVSSSSVRRVLDCVRAAKDAKSLAAGRGVVFVGLRGAEGRLGFGSGGAGRRRVLLGVW